MDERVDISTVIRAVRHRLWLAGAVVLCAVVAGFLVTAVSPKTYSSTSTVLVGDTTEVANIPREEILASQDLAATYSDLARRQPVLAAVVDKLGLDVSWLELRNRVQVNVAAGNAQLISVTAEARSTHQANQITRAITDQLIAIAPEREEEPVAVFITGQLERLEAELAAKQVEMADITARQASAATEAEAAELQRRADTVTRQINDMRNSFSDLRDLLPPGDGANSLRVFEPANADPAPVRPNMRTNVLAATLIGVLLAAGICYYAEVRTPASSPQRSSGGANATDLPQSRAGERELPSPRVKPVAAAASTASSVHGTADRAPATGRHG